MKTFAAISVGSYELAMKIFEYPQKGQMKCVDYIRHSIDLGTDTYTTGKISVEHTEELCRVLREFLSICKMYQVDAYKAYGTSAIREMDNREIVLDQIKARTGIGIEVLSNSEQRFMDYKSLASAGEAFMDMMEESTLVVDIGGGSIQISLFEQDVLVTTQNLTIGILRMREQLNRLKCKRSKYEEVAEEVVSSQINMFKKLFLRDRQISNLVVVDDYISEIATKKNKEVQMQAKMHRETFLQFYNQFHDKTQMEMAALFDLEEEKIPFLFLSSLLVKNMVQLLNIEQLCIPGVCLCDGIGYEYAEKANLVDMKHNFEQDIVACARSISMRYEGSKKQAESIWKISEAIFDTMKKVHGMKKRERLLLQIAVMLHDCGKYINLSNDGECSYSIIMHTEMIGLSHTEREMVANMVRFSTDELVPYNVLTRQTDIEQKNYLIIAKCSAIIKLARGLARSHKQKFKDVRAKLEKDVLHIYLVSNQDTTYEMGFINKKLDFFEEVYSVRPQIHCHYTD